MATTTISNPAVQIIAHCLATSGVFPVIADTVNHVPNIAIGAGSTTGNVNAVIEQTLAITSGTPATINVGTGTDPLNNVAGMVHVSMVLIENDSVTTGQDFTVGGGTHPVLGSDSYLCQANGGIVCVLNPSPGYTVSSGSTDTLTITVASGTAVPGKITIFGRTA